MEKNNIYLMDKPIDDINKDEFDYKSIVDEIVNNIQNNKPPYNIALIGKWGTGKSSILDCVKKEIENKDTEGYLFTTINAWKYEKQEIRKSFILEILSKIPNVEEKSNKIQAIIDSLNNIFMIKPKELEVKEKWYTKLWNIVKQSFVCILPLILMFLFAYLIIDIVLNAFGKTINDYNSIRLEQCGAFIMAILTEIGVIIKNNVLGKKPVNFYLEENEKDTNFYEKQLKKAIELYKEENEKFKSIICVVEDIDRLNANKMVEAISALKGFVGVDNLIFIVPYDTSILCKVLEESKTNKLSNNYEILEGELILNKLFQYKIYMPELIQEDMYEYIKNLIEKENNGIYRLFPNKKILVDDILPILMYEEIKTPRDAKQILNSFIIKYNIAISRNVIDYDNMNENEIRMLSVLTVLESDFNEFYSYILMYPTIINDFLETEKSDRNNNDIYKLFKNKVYKGRKFETLLAFLKYTTTIKIENVERFIYLNDSKIDKVSGGKIGKEFRFALANFDIRKAKKTIESINNITEMVNREMSYNSGNILKKKNIILTLISIYSTIKNVLDKNNIRNIIEENIEYIERSDYSNINIIELLRIFLDNKENMCRNICNVLNQKLDDWRPVYFYYQDEKNDLIDEKNILENELDMFINSYPYLNKEIQIKISNLLSEIGNYSKTEDDTITKYKVYTFIDYYNFIRTRINERNYYIVENNLLNRIVLCIKEDKIKLDELEVIKNIYVKDKKFDVYVEALVSTIKDEKSEKILEFLKTLQDNLDKTKIETKKAIFEILEDNSTDLLELDEAYELDSILKTIVVDVLKYDESNNVDALLMKLNEKIYINNTIEKLAKNNMLERIPNTISNINIEIIDKDDTEYTDMFRKIHNKYSLEEKNDILNKLYNKIHKQKNNINKVKDIFELLNIKNNREICINFITNIVDYIETNFSTLTDKIVRNELLLFATENINLLEKTEKEKLFDFINKKVCATDINISIECISNANFNDLDDLKWKDAMEKYIASTKLKLMDFIHIISKHIDVLVNNIDLKEQFIDRVINEFEPNDEIINVLQKININKESYVIKIYDLFSEYIDNPNIVGCMKDILDSMESILEIVEKIIKTDSDINLLLQVSHESKKIEIENIIKTIIEKYKLDNESFELNSKIKILKFIAERFNGSRKFKDDFVMLSMDIVNSIDNTEAEEVIEILIENKKILNKDNRKTLINKLEVTIEKMKNKDELIKKLEQLK